MLKQLSIKNYALIREMNVDFASGFNVLTGETGAGKSIILGALSLILGERADSKSLLNADEKCVIEGFFDLSNFDLKDVFEENDVDHETETIIRREINPKGKSRAFINDTPVSLQQLKEIGLHLIDIHSQHENLRINKDLYQINLLDVFAEQKELLVQYKESYKNYRAQYKILQAEKESLEKNQADLDYLEFQLKEIQELNPEEGEEEILEKEHLQISHSEDIIEGLNQIVNLLEEDDTSAISLIVKAREQMDRLKNFSPDLKELAERTQAVLLEMRDINASCTNIQEEVSYDPERFQYLEDRLNQMNLLLKKHKLQTATELKAYSEELQTKVNAIHHSDEHIQALEDKYKAAKDSCTKLALDLQKGRKAASISLSEKVSVLLRRMSMPNAEFKIEMTSTEDLGPYGMDKVSFLFSANKGVSPEPIHKVASGGELSRLMLAIKSLVAGFTALPTLIFDEVDTGVSGEVALKVGEVMTTLSENHQVLAITHLPQIAGLGTQHYLVYKTQGEDITETKLRILNELERVNEIAKMLSGDNPSEHALNNARELMGVH